MDTFKAKFNTKLPTRQELLPVFSTVLFFVFSWSLYRMFYQIPSWIGYLTLGYTFVLIAYVLAFALFESSVVFLAILLLNFILPTRIFRKDFVAQSSTLMLLVSVGAFFIHRNLQAVYDLNYSQLLLFPAIGLIIILLIVILTSILFSRFKKFTRLVNSIADRMIVFSIFYVPLGLISLLVVLIRNIFG